jgi:hypothetical protein
MKATYPRHHYFCKVRSDSAVSFLSLAEESQYAEPTASKQASKLHFYGYGVRVKKLDYILDRQRHESLGPSGYYNEFLVIRQ